MDKHQQVNVSCSANLREILMAEFAAIGFDIFQETESGFTTLLEEQASVSQVDAIIKRYSPHNKIAYWIEDVEQINWNKKWEESYKPIIIDQKCIVRAGFHSPQPEYPYEIIITPKMSFGTGHHETTYLMLKAQLAINHHNKTVLDAGSGTGILAILTSKLGAKQITAYDNDSWVIDSLQENFKINNSQGEIMLGTIQELYQTKRFSGKFDLILANINKNILLADIAYYARVLEKKGSLLLSGFYENDLPDIKAAATKMDLKLVAKDSKNNWCMAHFTSN